jgi:hypothetical protein
VYVLLPLIVNARLPLVALLPDQLPEAVQLLASVEDHDSVMLPPERTELGLAVSETVGAVVTGAALTVIVTDRVSLPPSPLQVSV